ncbi:MAG: hypothetical protein FIA95_14310 [Gemmatimonadetes bacterium]|nr:hypothetical protein [Gemmatimonadota bacterium]
MHKKRSGRIRAQCRLAFALLSVLAPSGCAAPAVEGYQLQAPPEGFLYSAQQGPGGSVIPGRRPEDGGFWFGDIRSDEPGTTVSLTRYRGALAEGDGAAAREARAQVLRGSPHNRLGPLRTLALADGRTASAWTEERHDEYGRFRSLQVTALVSYDTVSFALELDTSVPERMREAHLDSILATFGLGVTAVNPTLVLVGAAGALLLLVVLFRRAGRRQPTDYRTARVPRPPGKLVDRPPGS